MRTTPSNDLLLSALLRGLRFVAVSLAIGTVVGCSPDARPSGPHGVKLPLTQQSALTDAPELIRVAQGGAYRRGEQDDMLRREAELPGFGGFYIDSSGAIVVYMKPTSSIASGRIRQVMARAYASRSEPAVREIMAQASQAQIIEGQFTLSELIAVENRITANWERVPGLSGVGTSIFRNRVKVGFVNRESFIEGVRAITEMGVPESAVIPEVWGIGRAAAYFTDAVYPTRAGPQTTLVNRTREPHWGGSGSYGYNVKAASGVSYFLLTAHQANDLSGINGVVGDTILQPGGNTIVGKVVVNPPYDTSGCPIFSVTGQPYDFCTDADIAAAQLLPGVASERKLATSDIGGLNGASGSAHIHNYYPIQSVVSPEFMKMNPQLGVHKSGFVTGTTTGVIDPPLASQTIYECWGPFPYPTPAGAVCKGGTRKYKLLRRITKVLHIGIGFGDSGGPVFGGNGTPYYALGITAGGLFSETDTSRCTLGAGCEMYFTRWSDIEQQLGLGPLNPVTNQP